MHLATLVLLTAITQTGGGTPREIIRRHVAPSGQVSRELADQTGWHKLTGFRWQMRTVDADSDQGRSAHPGRVFRTGQNFRLRVEAYNDLWIYVLNVDQKGEVTVLLPDLDFNEPHMKVKQFETVDVPPRPDTFYFADGPGRESFRIIASPVKLTLDEPNRLVRLKSGQSVSTANTKSIDGSPVVGESRKRETYAKSLLAMLKEMKSDPEFRASAKDPCLMPPPDDGGQAAFAASADPNDMSIVVCDVVLRHDPDAGKR